METEQEEFPDTHKTSTIFGEFELDLILFLIVGFALRDLLQSFINDMFLPSTFNLLGIKSLKEKTWIPFHDAIPIRYGNFIESIYSFIIIVALVYIFVRVFSVKNK